MSVVSVWRKIHGDASLKIYWALACTGECQTPTKTFQIDNLVNVRFKANIKMLENDMHISLCFASSKHELAKNRIVKMNITNTNLKFSVRGIHVPEIWSNWQEIGTKRLFMKDNPTTYYTTTVFYVVVYDYCKETITSKLYTDNKFTDFNLAAAGGSVPVHRACMAVCSDVFRAMLTNEWKEKTEGRINMKGVTVQTLQHLKDFMYLGTVPDEGLRPLLLLARQYLIEDLERYCVRKLAETVTAEDLFSLIQFACENNIPELSFAMLQITQESVVQEAQQMKNKATLKRKSDSNDT